MDGTSRFVGQGRTVHADLFSHNAGSGSADAFLASLMSGAPAVPPGQQLTDRLPDGVRHAFWLTSGPRGHEQYELYGFTVHDSGTAVGVVCMWDAPEDLTWAQHVWRSVHRGAQDETPAMHDVSPPDGLR